MSAGTSPIGARTRSSTIRRPLPLWALGAAIGSLVGAVLQVFPVAGFAGALLLLVWAALGTHRVAKLSGLLTGGGVGTLLLVAWANERCRAARITGPGFDRGCEPGDATVFLATTTILLIAGAAMSALTFARYASKSERQK